MIDVPGMSVSEASLNFHIDIIAVRCKIYDSNAGINSLWVW